MNIGFLLCTILAVCFCSMGIVFSVLKERGAKYVSGFNLFSKEEQMQYDKVRISRDIRNQCFTWFFIMGIGATLSYFITSYIAIPTFLVWLFLFFKDVHLDAYKAFDKYRIK